MKTPTTSAVSILQMVFGLLLLTVACTKEEFITSADAKLRFSADSLSFDTVFTARGSATRSIKIYNDHDQFLRVDRIWLVENSFFRMNVDGIPGNDLKNIEIPPNDSTYVFVEVTVDPDQPLSESPFVIGEELYFETNGNTQSVILEAWGQNANYLPRLNAGGQQNLYTCQLNDWIWDDPKPYVLFGVVVIDSCNVVMPPGTRVYIHGGFGRAPDGDPYNDGILYFFRRGRLTIEGSTENPVIVEGDRLEKEFSHVPGQWGRIQLGPGTQGHKVDNAIIRNGIVGLLVDSLAEVTITNTQIYNTSSSALVGYSGRIVAENCLFHSSGSNNVSLILGGNYLFSYCTLANYGTSTESLSASNFVCLDGLIPCDEFRAAPLNMTFRNSIIYGSSRDVIALNDGIGDQVEGYFNYRFSHCLVKVEELLDEDAHPDFFENCDPCLNGEEPVFINPDVNDYYLDTLSVAIGQASPILSINKDLDGVIRDPDAPDLGCYERVE